MDAAANCAQRAIKAKPLIRSCPRHPGYGYALLHLLAAFGVLAFIFSAVSPADDDIQQEFFKTSKSKQCVFAHYKNAVSNLRVFRIRAVYCALNPPRPQFPSRFVKARVPGDKINNRVCSGNTGDRSPPTVSS